MPEHACLPKKRPGQISKVQAASKFQLAISVNTEIKGALLTILLLGGMFLVGYTFASLRHTVYVSGSAKLGSFLVDGNGRTLYSRSPSGVPGNCTSQNLTLNPCNDAFPIFPEGRIIVQAPLKLDDFGFTYSGCGDSWQVTYKGCPLYYFANDTIPGDTKGEGFQGLWHVAPP